MYKIVEKKILNPTVIQLLIDAPLVANKAKPGQFIILRVDEEGERIPLTVAGVNKNDGTVKIIFQVVGSTTKKLSYKEAGECIQDFVGPLGVATHLDGLKKVCIVGGGVGCAIALPVAEALHEMGADVTSIIGFRNKDLVKFTNVNSHLGVLNRLTGRSFDRFKRSMALVNAATKGSCYSFPPSFFWELSVLCQNGHNNKICLEHLMRQYEPFGEIDLDVFKRKKNDSKQ